MSVILNESSMSRVLSKTLNNDIAIFTAFRTLREDADKESQRIVWGKSREDGKREIVAPSYIKGEYAKDVLEANNIANRKMLVMLKKYGFDIKQIGATSVIGSYVEDGNTEATNENSFVVENDGDSSENFARRILSVTSAFKQDGISLLPKVDNLKDSYIFIISGDVNGIACGYLGKLSNIGKKDLNDKRAKTIVGNKQIEYDVDWSKQFTPQMIIKYIEMKSIGVDEDFEELCEYCNTLDLERERDFITKRKGAYNAISPADRERIKFIDEILKNS